MNIQLANEYLKYMAKRGKKPAFWWVSPKLDGIRAFKRLGEPICSRAGNRFFGFECIEDDLDTYMKQHGLTWVDGELYTHLPFQEIQSVVRAASHHNKKAIIFYMFGAGDDTPENSTYMNDVLHVAASYFVDSSWMRVRVIPLHHVESGLVEMTMKDYVLLGYEGIMLRHPEKLIEFKRNDALLKYKPFHEADFIITGFFEGKGHIAGMLGGFYMEGVVELIDPSGVENVPVKVRFKVGSGFTKTGFLDSRDSLYRIALEGCLEGNLAEIKYQEITDKPDKDGYYSLRFPVFVKLKQDR